MGQGFALAVHHLRQSTAIWFAVGATLRSVIDGNQPEPPYEFAYIPPWDGDLDLPCVDGDVRQYLLPTGERMVVCPWDHDLMAALPTMTYVVAQTGPAVQVPRRTRKVADL